MTRILHAIPSLEGGGAERQLTMLAIEQARRGWDVHVALERGGVHEGTMRAGGVAIHVLGNRNGLHPLLMVRFAALLRRIRPDVLQTWLVEMDIAAGVATLGTSVPWVVSERASREAYEHTPRIAWVRARAVRRSRAIVANSIAGARYWASVLSEAPPITTVANAVDVDAIQRAAPIATDAGMLLFVGRLAPQKAPEILIEAIRRLPEARALLIGEGPLRDTVSASIATLGGRVSLRPYQASWWGLLKTAAALVSPSRFEGHPNVVLEAMAAGCPLVVSDIPEHREVVDESSALIVPRDDPAALAAALASLLADPAAARQRVEHASRRVAGFTIQRAADAYERVYASVLRRL